MQIQLLQRHGNFAERSLHDVRVSNSNAYINQSKPMGNGRAEGRATTPRIESHSQFSISLAGHHPTHPQIIHLILFYKARQRHAQNARRKERKLRPEPGQSSLVDTGLLVATIGQVVCAGEGVLVVGHVPAALETLHLPGLQLAEVLLASVDAANLVADDVGFDVLLRPGLWGC